MRSSRPDVADQRLDNPGRLSRHCIHMNAAAHNVAADVLLLVHPAAFVLTEHVFDMQEGL